MHLIRYAVATHLLQAKVDLETVREIVSCSALLDGQQRLIAKRS